MVSQKQFSGVFRFAMSRVGLSGFIGLGLVVCDWVSPGIPRATAQSIVPDTDATTTSNTRVIQTGNQFDIDGGVRSLDNTNLFHSFQELGLSRDQIANFLATPELENILTRVTSGKVSSIDGLLQVSGGNANLFLMNPAGILFGPNARLNVGADFMVTTASAMGFDGGWFSAAGANDYANLTGDPGTFAFGQSGAITNSGLLTINADHTLSLVGNTVVNTGLLSAPDGQIILQAVPENGHLRLGGDGYSLSLVPQGESISGPGPNPLPFSVPPLSQLLAIDGIREATELSLNPDGTVALSHAGTIIPTEAGVAIASGTLNASGIQGGTVQVLGDRVGLVDASVDVSGRRGSGIALIGGDYQGNGIVPNAQVTYVGPDSEIVADSLNRGDGGRVIVWADGSTDFRGTISATGGARSGDGGFAEVSGKQNLGYYGIADLSAANGLPGTLLLDPENIEIIAGNATQSGDASLPIIDNDPPTPGTLFISEGALEDITGDIILQATSNIIIDPAITVIDFPNYGGTNIIFRADGGSFSMNENATFFTRGRNLTIEALNDITTGIILANDGPGDSAPEGSENSGNIVLNAGGDITVNYLIARSNSTERLVDGRLTGVGTGLGGSIIIEAGGIFTATGEVTDGLENNTNNLVANGGNPVAIRTSGLSGTGRLDHDGDGSVDAIFIRANSINIPNGQVSSFTNTNPAEINNPVGGAVTIISDNDITLQGINFETGRIESGGDITIAGTLTVSNDDNNFYAINTRTENLTINASRLIIPDDSIINASLLLSRDTEISTTNNTGSITMEGDINSITGENVSLTIMDDFNLQGNIGMATPLTSFQMNDVFNFNGEEIITINDQIYSDSIEFNTDTRLEGSIIRFTDSVDNNTINLDIVGNASLGQDVTVNSLTISGEANTDGGTIATVGDQVYGDAFNLNGNTVLTTTNGDITLDGTVDGSHDLTISTDSGEILFADTAGATAPLNDLAIATPNTLTIANGLTIQGTLETSASDLNLEGDVQVGSGDVTITYPIDLQGDASISAATGTIQLNEAVTSSGEARNFNLSASGDITIQSIDTNGGDLGVSTTSGTITTGALSTVGNNGGGGAITLGSLLLDSNLTLTSGGGNINFLGTVDGPHNLTVSAGSGDIGFADSIGNTAPLNDLILNNTGTLTFADGAVLNGSLTQEGAASVNLSGTFTSEQGDITFGSPLQLTEATAIATTNGNINLTAEVTQSQPSNLSLAANQGAIATNGITGNNIAITATSITTNNENITATGGVDLNADTDILAGAIAATNDVNLTTTDGAIAIDAIVGNNITIAANNNSITSANINAIASVELNADTNITTGAIAATNDVNLTATNGAIATNAITGNNIDLNAGTDITTGAIATNATTGNNIAIAANNSITSDDITATGSVELNADTGITTGAIAATNGIDITATNGPLIMGNLTSNGSNISLSATNGITAGPTIDSDGGNVRFRGTVTADNLTINADTGNINFRDQVTLNTLDINTSGLLTIANGLELEGALAFPDARRIQLGGDISIGQGDVEVRSPITLIDPTIITAENGAIVLTEAVRSNGSEGNRFFLTADQGGIETAAIDTTGRIQFSASDTITANGNLVTTGDRITFDTADDITVRAIATDGGNVTLNTFGDITTGAIATDGGNVALNTSGDITTGAIATGGGNVGFNTFGDITTGAIATNGGNISLIADSDQTIVTTENLNSSNDEGGGDITVEAGLQITTGNIDASAVNGNGGSVSLDPTGDIEVGFINTQSQNAAGGDITAITTGSFFRATNTFTSNPTEDNPTGILTSISALGVTQGGDITITHDGGGQLTFFNIDDLNQNGTAAAIVTGTAAAPNIIPSGEAYLGPYAQLSDQGVGDIQLITDPVPTPDILNEDEQEDPALSEDIDTPFGLEHYFTNLYEHHFEHSGTRIKTLSEIQETLRQIEHLTGVRSAVLYAFFAPEGYFELWQEVEHIHPGLFTLDDPAIFDDVALDALMTDPDSTSLESAHSYHERGVSIEQRDTLDQEQLRLEMAFAEEHFNLAEEDMRSQYRDVRAVSEVSEAERLEDILGLVLVTATDAIAQPVPDLIRGDASDQLQDFRDEIFKHEQGRTSNIEPHAQNFYHWLLPDHIGNTVTDQGIEHLTFILDHELRGVPLAALHNGDTFIINNLSVNMMPSFSLTDTDYTPFQQSRVLAMGTTDFKDHNLSNLPAVAFELKNIENIYNEETIPVILFENSDFTSNNLREDHRDHFPETIHLATHARFNRGNVNESHLYFANGEHVSLGDIHDWNLNDPAVNLMLLSACNTAMGNENAELGFAGVAYKSQITSVLGSLWTVDDVATSVLMTAFHHTLAHNPQPSNRDDGEDVMTKANALRLVQLALLNSDITIEEQNGSYSLTLHSGEQEFIPIPETLYPALDNLMLDQPVHWSSFVVVGSPW